MREALEEADDIGEARGGSTITQQVAKNLFLWQGRSYRAQGAGIAARAVDQPRAAASGAMLEIYLNIAEWGPNGEFGAEAGARFAFGKSARDLDAREAAQLASILPNPIRRSARQPGRPGSPARRAFTSAARRRIRRLRVLRLRLAPTSVGGGLPL